MQSAVGEDPDRALSAEALREWSGHVDGVLRGVAHALNNRAASVAALIDLTHEPDHGPASLRSLLATELARVRELMAAIRNIGAPRSAVEAFEPRDAVEAARGVIQTHAALRERGITIEVGTASPVRTARWMLVRSLVALAGAVSAEVHGATIVVSDEDGWVVVRAAGAGAKGERSVYADEMARAMGGEPLRTVPGFRLPTLAALRQREGR